MMESFSPTSSAQLGQAFLRLVIHILVAAVAVVHPLAARSQWVISAIHPDPTPPIGAPEAEYIALVAWGADSCATLDGYVLNWNGNERALPSGCWPQGTVIVAHRTADSAAFPGIGAAAPFSSWPALVNGGGMVVLNSAEGAVIDAMPYDADMLGNGGRPLLRRNPAGCGAGNNVRLWTEGMDPYFAPDTSGGADEVETHAGALQQAREADRLVPRGPGRLDWSLGSVFDPVSVMGSSAWVGGQEVSVHWTGDSTASLHWSERLTGSALQPDSVVPIALGPLRLCSARSEAHIFTMDWQRTREDGDIHIVGVLPDPLPGGSGVNVESLALYNASPHAVELGSWSFQGAWLKRSTIVAPNETAWLGSHQFQEWPGMPNHGGSWRLASATGQERTGFSWHPCDHDRPAMAGSGVPLIRQPQVGADWESAGTAEPPILDPTAIRGYGCPRNAAGDVQGVDLYFNRYVDFLPPMEWSVIGGGGVAVASEALEGMPDGMRLSWEGCGSDATVHGGVLLEGETPGWPAMEVRIWCPATVVGADDSCIRMGEVLWNASAEGAEFVELVNCGALPVELAGLEATTEPWPLPSDWRRWIPSHRSVVLMPGAVAAFGPCASWVGNGFPERGPSRWTAEAWAALNDQAGTLTVRLGGAVPHTLDAVAWSDTLKGPWWWEADGWSWVRIGAGERAWSPSADRGSPGSPGVAPMGVPCDEAVNLIEAVAGAPPGLRWSLPDAGGAIEVRVLHWPSGLLMEHVVLEEVLTQGSWVWTMATTMDATALGGIMVWDVRWWGGSCKGHRRFRLALPWLD